MTNQKQNQKMISEIKNNSINDTNICNVMDNNNYNKVNMDKNININNSKWSQTQTPG